MSSKWVWATTLAAVAGSILFVDLVAGQEGRRGGGGMFGRGGIVGLLAAEPVQKELGITEDQKEKVSTLVSDYGTEAREQRQTAGLDGFREASDEERQKLFAKMQEMNQQLNAKYTPKVKEVLKPEQFTRLQQIGWQATGSAAFSDPELAKALELSKKQQDDIAAITQEYQKKLRDLLAGGNPQEAFSKMRELGQERDKKAEEVLSKEQQEEFKELKGKPFDLAQLRPSGRGKGKDNG